MTDSVFVRPRTGLIVRDPITREPLPADGAKVPRTPYWLRRLRAGDIVPAAKASPPKDKASPKATGTKTDN